MVDRSIYVDRAITDLSEDLFDRAPFVRRLASALISRDGKATGGVIGLVGEWGSGKTSILNLISSHLDEMYPDALAVVFSPWLITTRDQLLTAFFKELISSLDEKFGRDEQPYSSQFDQLVDEAIEALRQYGNALSPLVSKIPKIGFAAGIVFNWFEKFGKDRESLAHKKKVLEQKLQAIQKPIVVIIDELDRVEDEEIRLMAQLVRSVMNFEAISYLLAYDEVRVSEALGSNLSNSADRQERGKKYLEKIVQLQIRVPPLLEGELHQLAASEIERILTGEKIQLKARDKERMDTLITKTVPALLISYRSLKRVVADFALRMPMVNGEVTPTDVLGFIILEVLSPNSVREVHRSWDSIVFDGRDYERLAGAFGDRSKRLDNWISDCDKHNPNKDLLRWLLEFLFPMLAIDRPNKSEQDDIAYRRPLRTLLRLSPTTFDVTREKLVKFCQLNEQNREKYLEEIIEQNNFDSFLQRLREVYFDLNLNHSDTWYLLCKKIETYFGNAPSYREQLATDSTEDDIANTLIYLTSRHEELRLNLPAILEKLGSEKLTGTATKFLRRAKKIAEESSARDISTGNVPLDPLQVSLAGNLLAGKIRTGIEKKGYNSINDPTIFYFLRDFGFWKDTDREAYTQLIEKDATQLDRLVFSLFGGHFAADRSGIDVLVKYLEFERLFMERFPEVVHGDDDRLLKDAYEKATDHLNLAF